MTSPIARGEGLHVPSALTHLLETLVSEANRANLTIYALDPRGLRTEGSFEEAKLALVAARNLSEKAQRQGEAQTAAGRVRVDHPVYDLEHVHGGGAGVCQVRRCAPAQLLSITLAEQARSATARPRSGT